MFLDALAVVAYGDFTALATEEPTKVGLLDAAKDDIVLSAGDPAVAELAAGMISEIVLSVDADEVIPIVLLSILQSLGQKTLTHRLADPSASPLSRSMAEWSLSALFATICTRWFRVSPPLLSEFERLVCATEQEARKDLARSSPRGAATDALT